MELPDGKQLKVVIHCNDCGYTKANIYPNLKLLTKSGFLVHDVPGADEKCMDLGWVYGKYQLNAERMMILSFTRSLYGTHKMSFQLKLKRHKQKICDVIIEGIYKK